MDLIGSVSEEKKENARVVANIRKCKSSSLFRTAGGIKVARTYRVPSVERAFRIIAEISQEPDGLSLGELIERVSMPKTTAFMLLSALRDLEVLIQRGSRYTLGPSLVRLAGQALQRLDLRAVAGPYMQGLVDQTGFTSHIGVLNGEDVIFIDKAESTHFIQFLTYPGMTQPFHLSSLGKAIVSFLPDAQVDALLARAALVRKTVYTITDAEQFKAAMANIRAQGYAVENEENEEGVRCIGAPIFDRDGNVTAALSITALSQHLPAESFPKIAALVIAAANGISQQLGCERPPILAVEGGARR